MLTCFARVKPLSVVLELIRNIDIIIICIIFNLVSKPIYRTCTMEVNINRGKLLRKICLNTNKLTEK